MTSTSATPSSLPVESTIPPNQFDLLPDLYALLQRVYNDDLDAKDIGTESNALRLKISKARTLLANLPDIQKTRQEQREEMDELVERIKKQRQMLKEIGELEAVKEAVERSRAMEGVEMGTGDVEVEMQDV
jgi:soluble cytochrome b562